jgi:hypothetical protein
MVAFTSDAPIVAADTNGLPDVYVFDFHASELRLVSRATDGAIANGPSRSPSLADNGRFVVYTSDATNLAAGDGNHATDAFVTDLASGLTQRLSGSFWLGSLDGPTPSVTVASTGGVAAFASFATNATDGPDPNGTLDVLRHALVTPEITDTSGAIAHAGDTVPLTISGRGFRAPVNLATSAGTASTGTVTATSVAGTLHIAASTPPGTYDVIVTGLSSQTGIFGGTICAGCLTVIA